VDTRPTLLKVLLTQQHLQRYETFRAEYERVASQLAPELRHTAPSMAQYYRWLTGQLKGGIPYPDACRVLEGMFPPWTVSDLFGPPPTSNGRQLRADGASAQASVGSLLTSVPHSFSAEMLQGSWVTSYQFSRVQPPKLHVDIAHVTVESERRVSANNYPPEPHTEGHVVAFRNEIEAQLVNRHLIGCWKNSSDTRYFGSLHIAVLPGEIVMEGYYTSYSSDIEVAIGRWKWIRLNPVSLSGVDLSKVTLREPRVLYGLMENYTQYDPPLSLDAVVEEA
jgi:hypothetical protein